MKDYCKLSPRELEVLSLMAKGYDNGEISEVFCTSEVTVKSQVISIYSKLGLETRRKSVLRVKAVLYYLEHKEELGQ